MAIFECKRSNDLWEHCLLFEADAEKDAKEMFLRTAWGGRHGIDARRAAHLEGPPKVDPCTCGNFAEFKWKHGKVGIFCRSCGLETVLLDRVSFAELHWSVKTRGITGEYFNGTRLCGDG